MHWAEDPYWLDALKRYQEARERGDTTLCLDLEAIEKIAFDSDGPAYRCLEAMGSVLEHEGLDGYRGAPRLVFALLMRLAERSSRGTPSLGARTMVPRVISLFPSPNPTIRRAVRVLSMVHELHKAGYQLLRICPGYTLDLQHWRCYVGPAAHFHRDGWTPSDSASLLSYTTALDHEYFGWTDAANDDARRLAAKFLERHPGLARQAAGEDWAYAGWFAHVLGHAEHGSLPEFFGGRNDHLGEPGTPYPPHWVRGEPYAGTGQPLLANDELTRADLPPPGADYEALWPFCLSFDGYRACRLAGDEPHLIAAETERAGLQQATIECLRITAFMLQRSTKWDDAWPPDQHLLSRIHAVVEEIRRRLPA